MRVAAAHDHDHGGLLLTHADDHDHGGLHVSVAAADDHDRGDLRRAYLVVEARSLPTNPHPAQA